MDDGLDRTSRVIRLARQFELVRREILAARELDLWEYDVLAALRSALPPHELSPGALVDETLVASGTMTNRVDRLSRRGYVTREPDPADRRGVLVRLTVSGRKKVDSVAAELAAAEAAVWQHVAGRKSEQFDGTVRELLATLDR
ncbi:MAG TPA: MarR family transcriptional regulator [Acidothermaceae bacterium]|jgi:DNA-binding MarR family transcriptional regulator|nr:MarR family transcriptional regulator [Acidothermaceae bacterium]